MEPQVVVVTGTSSGFGELIARTLALHGHNVFASMRDVAGRNAPSAEAMTAWAQEHDARVEVIELDVADAASVQAGIDRVFERAGRIDVVANNAGISAAGPIEAFDIEQMQALFDVNVFGPMRVDKAVLPHMRERRSGLLIHVSSTLGRVLPGLGGLYPASKWAVEGLAESLHYQLKPFGINVVILEPGSFPTPAITRGLVAADRDTVAAYASQTGPRRPRAVPEDYTPPDPQEVADAVLALVEAPPEGRPLRQVVGPIFTEGVAEYNVHYEQVRDRLAESLKRPDQTINWGPR